MPTPTISANTATNVCPGNSVSMSWNYDYLFFQGSGTPTYQWKKDAVNINGATSSSFTATQGPGAYTLMISKNGCSVTSAPINVTNSGTAPTEVPTITGPSGAISPIATCSPSITLSASGCGVGQTVYWSTNQSGTAIPVTPSPNDFNYFARCGTSATCLSAASSAMTVGFPKVEIIKTVGITACDPTILTASSSPNTNVTFQWQNNFNDISGATGNQYLPTNGSSYQVAVVFANLPGGNCNITSASVSTTSTPAVTTPIVKACKGVNPNTCTVLASPVTLFAGSSITLQASNCNATVTWSTGATGTSLVVATAGTYAATCSNGTCTSPNSTTIQVIVNPCNAAVNLAHPANDITTNPTINGTLWQASTSNGAIAASNWITGSGTRVTYEAKSITFSPGFIADSGTIFSASVGGCN